MYLHPGGSDFETEVLEVTFSRNEANPSEDRPVSIVIDDDVVNEADEVFVVLLELVSDVPADRVNLQVQNASLCRIEDDDRKWSHFKVVYIQNVSHLYKITYYCIAKFCVVKFSRSSWICPHLRKPLFVHLYCISDIANWRTNIKS